MVMDTETLGVDKPLIYDLGVTIADKQGRIYAQANWIVKEVFEQKDKMQSAYYANKLPRYKEMIEKGLVMVKPWNEIIEEYNQMIVDYNVSVVSAYNLGFDKRAMTYTNKCLGNRNKVLRKNVELWDIWGMATQTILKQKTYQRMADSQNWRTPKGNILTNAEVAYRYITNNVDFIEDHTALSDTEIETAIMARCIRQRKKMDKGILANPWKFAQACV